MTSTTPPPSSPKPALWFSRHSPTPEQIGEITSRGFALTKESVEAGLALGSRSIETDEDLCSVLSSLRALAWADDAQAIFGVFPTPVLGSLHNTSYSAVLAGDYSPRDIPCFAAWNVSRTPEGGRPTFTHKQWVLVGLIYIPKKP